MIYHDRVIPDSDKDIEMLLHPFLAYNKQFACSKS